MDWKGWESWKVRDLITVSAFIITYLLTIPIRNYTFLNSIIDTTQGVTPSTHIAIIVIASLALIALLELIALVIRLFSRK
jgi:hypothetical protein